MVYTSGTHIIYSTQKMFTFYVYRVIKLQNFGQFQAFGGKYFDNNLVKPDFTGFFDLLLFRDFL